MVVAYVNTTADVKAKATTAASGNAVEVVNSIPADREILSSRTCSWARTCRLTGRENMHVWMGECHVHAGIDPGEHPSAAEFIPRRSSDTSGVRLFHERARDDVGGDVDRKAFRFSPPKE